MSTVFDFSDWLAATSARTESALERLLDSAQTTPARLHEAMRYAAQGGGKRIRPLLVYAAGQLGRQDEHQEASGHPAQNTDDTRHHGQGQCL